MSAPQSVVDAVMEEMGCGPFWATRRANPRGDCIDQKHGDWTDRGCFAAAEIADAAWKASLLAAAERLDGASIRDEYGPLHSLASSSTLRGWADEDQS